MRRAVVALLAALTLSACGASTEEQQDQEQERKPSYAEQVQVLCERLTSEYIAEPEPMCIRDGEIVNPKGTQ